jgi:hypothetical protein
MRTFAGGSIGITLAAIVLSGGVGCTKSATPSHSAAPSKPATQPMAAERPADAEACVLQSGGKDVLRVMASPDTVCTPKDGSLRLKAHGSQVDIWLVADAKSVDDAMGKIPGQISSEFKDFKPTSMADLTVAGNPARRMMGTGTEADDGDPGSADVVVFKAGDHVFVACTHAEKIPPDAPPMMMAILMTAKAP